MKLWMNYTCISASSSLSSLFLLWTSSNFVWYFLVSSAISLTHSRPISTNISYYWLPIEDWRLPCSDWPPAAPRWRGLPCPALFSATHYQPLTDHWPLTTDLLPLPLRPELLLQPGQPLVPGLAAGGRPLPLHLQPHLAPHLGSRVFSRFYFC